LAELGSFRPPAMGQGLCLEVERLAPRGGFRRFCFGSAICAGHASFRSRLVGSSITACCTRWSDKKESRISLYSDGEIAIVDNAGVGIE
ncbi:hypothetical protein PQR37_35755, partial [Paraburkholderia nemoris]|uniref:hypothetical protein n=1 Tax=Paraburkholderia nemoris TaxID=2793076 RepID=UPI0038B7CFC0